MFISSCRSSRSLCGVAVLSQDLRTLSIEGFDIREGLQEPGADFEVGGGTSLEFLGFSRLSTQVEVISHDGLLFVIVGFDVLLHVVVIQTLEDMGAMCEIRMAQRKDGPVITDNGNFVIDAKFEKIESPEHMEIDLNTIPGVVENGIFSQMVDKVIVGTPKGTKEL